MQAQHSADVLVIGGGPVGLTLAMDLSQRGVKVLVLETRHRGEAPSVKCNHVSARSMEIFRRLGVAEAVRAAGLPEDYPNDVAYRTSVTGIELSRISIPARKDRYTAVNGPDTGWPTPEPPHRINQIFFEPILFAHAEAARNVRILNRTQFVDLEQDETGVSVVATNLDTEATLRLRGKFMIGCDGGRSIVRKKIGAKLTGTSSIGSIQSTYLRAPSLLEALKHPPAWATFALNTRRCGNVYAIDGRETWLVHNYLAAEETFDSVDRDWAIRQILGVGPEFPYEVISKEDWVARRLVADRFRDRRVFICGDAAHVWVPMAGYGMNAGIADAIDLSWTLAAYINGWGAEGILDAYEAERLPITEQVSQFAMSHAIALQGQRESVPANIEDCSPIGDAARAAVGRALYDLNVQQYCCAGLNFGYFYDRSPLIAYDNESAPAYSMGFFTPSTVPGCRTPHVWLEDGRSLYDALGPEYTLIRSDASVDVQPLVSAARDANVPMEVLDLAATPAKDHYVHALVLSRPDQHIAWRGNACPTDSNQLISRIRGAAVTPLAH